MGRKPTSVMVVIGGDTLVITMHGVLTPAEMALAEIPAGASQLQEFHQELFQFSSEPLRREIKRITELEISEDAKGKLDRCRAGVLSRGSGTGVPGYRRSLACRELGWEHALTPSASTSTHLASQSSESICCGRIYWWCSICKPDILDSGPYPGHPKSPRGRDILIAKRGSPGRAAAATHYRPGASATGGHFGGGSCSWVSVSHGQEVLSIRRSVHWDKNPHLRSFFDELKTTPTVEQFRRRQMVVEFRRGRSMRSIAKTFRVSLDTVQRLGDSGLAMVLCIKSIGRTIVLSGDRTSSRRCKRSVEQRVLTIR